MFRTWFRRLAVQRMNPAARRGRRADPRLRLSVQSLEERTVPTVVANPDAYSTSEDTPLTVSAEGGLLVNDTDTSEGSLSVQTVAQPSHGTVAVNSEGSFTYTPDADFNGTDTFTYTATDGSEESDPATVEITVDPVNDQPAAADGSAGTDEDTAVTVDLRG